MAGGLFIISAPSGAGKSTILRHVLTRIDGLVFSISHTTRAPRHGERDGLDYFFVDRAAFQRMIDENAFLEWAEVHGNLYGTSRQAVEDMTARGLDVLLDIDVQGARQIRKAALPNARFLFIVPPSWTELERRLTGRDTDSAEVVRLRLQNARREMSALPEYDYVITNDRLEEATDACRAIIIAERCRSRRSPSGIPLPNPLA